MTPSSAHDDLFQGLSALVIDDSPLMRRLVRSLLRQFGFSSVDEAENGSAALRQVERHRYDVAICDWMMEPTNGLEFVRALRRHSDPACCGLPVIMVTSVANKAQVLAVRDQGVTEYLVKPISAAKLEKRLVAALSRPRSLIMTDRYSGPDRRRPREQTYGGPRRRLADRVADLPWEVEDDEAAIRRAAEGMPDYAAILREEVTTLRALLTEVEAGGAAVEEAWHRIFRIAHDISGQAPSFGHGAAAAVGTSLERLLQPVLKTPAILARAAERRVRAVRTHVEALALLLEEGIAETSPETDMLVERLRLAVERVRREEAGPA